MVAECHENETEDLISDCLTYMPWIYQGGGVALTCVSLLEHFPHNILTSTLILPKALRPIPRSINVKQTIPFPLRGYFLWRLAEQLRAPLLNTYFSQMIRRADPSKTLAHFWPAPPASLVRHARDHDVITIREMINTTVGNAKVVLDDAYDRVGLQPDHNITQEIVDREREELALYDYIFAPNYWVEKSRLEAGIKPARILRSSFGWSPARLMTNSKDEGRTGFRAL